MWGSMGRTQKETVAARKEKVEKLIESMKGEGYSQKDLSVDGNKANLMALVTGSVPSVVFVLLFGLLCGWGKFMEVDYLLVMVVFLVSVIIHEGIHGLFFGLFAKNRFKSIEFGIIWKSVTPYCYCAEPVSRAQYLTALLMPGFLLGICAGIAGILTGSAPLVVFAVFSLFAAGGDFYIAYLILKTPGGKEEKYLDHPEQPGLLLLAKE